MCVVFMLKLIAIILAQRSVRYRRRWTWKWFDSPVSSATTAVDGHGTDAVIAGSNASAGKCQCSSPGAKQDEAQHAVSHGTAAHTSHTQEPVERRDAAESQTGQE